MSPTELQPFEPVVTEYAGYAIEPHMVLIQTCTAGICQSDRRIMIGAKASSLTTGFRLVLGHEHGGRVVMTGSGVEGLRANDKVVVLPHWTCGRCRFCRANRPNLCRRLRHAGFHYHGGFSRYGCFPARTIYPVGDAFPEDLQPLVEPLACVLRGVTRARDELGELSCRGTPAWVEVRGGGPMGSLLAQAVRRFYPELRTRIVEPHPVRRRVLEQMGFADDVVDTPRNGDLADVSFVASSPAAASAQAIAGTRPRGTVVLFAGINNNDLAVGTEARFWEHIHRGELDAEPTVPGTCGRYLRGSSGYTRDDVALSVDELIRHSRYWDVVQNVVIDGLESTEANYLGPPGRERLRFDRPAVEIYLSPLGVADPIHGEQIARSLKVLIRLGG